MNGKNGGGRRNGNSKSEGIRDEIQSAGVREKERGREGGRDTDRRIERGRDRDTPLSSSGAPLDSVRLDGLTDVIPPTVRALIGILSTQLLVCYTLGFFISIPSFRNTCQCRSAAARIN